MAYPYQQYPYIGYGGYTYPPINPYGQQLLTSYPANNYYAANPGILNPYNNIASYYHGYSNPTYYGNNLYGYGGYGSTMGYIPYKPSALRSLINRIRHGTSYPYSYPYASYDYARQRGNWIDYT
ncbi:hypothetical protein EDC96DRAFT_527249 [Choanephora cucurbitarum]|nr:hypothetical protein EDC96DRAFT_527249 [Choanephora cucurbitarum]